MSCSMTSGFIKPNCTSVAKFNMDEYTYESEIHTFENVSGVEYFHKLYYVNKIYHFNKVIKTWNTTEYLSNVELVDIITKIKIDNRNDIIDKILI